MRRIHPNAVSLGLLSLVWPVVLTACHAGQVRCPDHPAAKQSSLSRSGFAPFASEPKARVGSLPFTGAFTLFVLGDPSSLGTHHYGGSLGSGSAEKRKGILYTRYGGFLDIAHLRKGADWTAYHHVRIKCALSQGWNCIILPSKESSVYHMRFTYPPQWSTLPDIQRQALIDEASIRLAQRLAITQTTWHEIMTWFGYSSLPLISEKGSAFTYEDTTSHILGAKIAGMALRDKSSDYDSAVTRYLKEELRRLGAVTGDETLRAIHAVEGRWWQDHHVIRRYLDIGEGDGVVTPWIVPNFDTDQGTAAQPFDIPSLENVLGHDMRHFVQVEIEPRVFQWQTMRRLLPGQPERVDPDNHFPVLMNHIRKSEH